MVHRRLAWLAGLVLLWVAAIFFKIVSLQVVHHREYSDLARARQEVVNETPAPRGTIFDRMGQPLAMSVPGKSVYINPLKVDIGSGSPLPSRGVGLDRPESLAPTAGAGGSGEGARWIPARLPICSAGCSAWPARSCTPGWRGRATTIAATSWWSAASPRKKCN